MGEIPKLTPEEELALCEGFLAGRAGELPMVEALRPRMRLQVRRRWPRLWMEVDDLEQIGIVSLFELRAADLRTREEEKTREKKTLPEVRPTLVELVGKLLQTGAKRMQRWRQRTADLTPAVAKAQVAFGATDDAVKVQLVRRLFKKLPNEQAEVLGHYADALSGDGPPLHEALETTRELARKRLTYAQKLLLLLVRKEKERHG